MSPLSSITKLYHRISKHIDRETSTLSDGVLKKRNNKTVSRLTEDKLLHIGTRTLDGSNREPDRSSIGNTKTQIRKSWDVVNTMNDSLPATKSLSALLRTLENQVSDAEKALVRQQHDERMRAIGAMMMTFHTATQTLEHPVAANVAERRLDVQQPAYPSSVSSDSWSEEWESVSTEGVSDDERANDRCIRAHTKSPPPCYTVLFGPAPTHRQTIFA